MAGLGISFMGVTNARAEIGRGALRDIPLAPLPMIRNLGLIYRKDKPLSRAALGFIEVVVEFARAAEAPVSTKQPALRPRKTSKAS